MTKPLRLWSLTWPLALEIGLIMLMYSVDVWLLSTISDDVVAGVGVADQLIYLLIILFGVCATGASAVAAQWLGAGNREKALTAARIGLMLNVLLGILVTVSVLRFGDFYLRWMNVEQAVYEPGHLFLLIAGGGLWIHSFSMTLSALLRIHGHTKDPLAVTIGINIIHLILASTVIFGWFGVPKLGVAGAAASLVFSQFLGMLVLVFMVRHRIGLRIWALQEYSWDRESFRAIMKVGLPAAGEEAIWQISQLLITYIVSMLGSDDLAARVYTFNILLLIMQGPIALAIATSILVGHDVGAGRTEEAYRRVHRSFGYSLIFSFILLIFMTMFREQLFGLFTEQEQIIQTGTTLLLIGWIMEPGRNFNLIYIKALNASGDARFPVFWALISMLGVSVPLAYALAIPAGLGLIGVWIALTVDEWTRGLLMFIRWRSKKWVSKKLIPEGS